MPLVPKVLIVEDDLIFQHSLKLALQLSGVAATLVGNGSMAVTLLGGETFDLIFLDIFLPGMDGFDVAKQIRSRNLGQPYIVAMSSTIVLESPEVIHEAGFDEFQVKPLSPATVEDVLERWRKKSSTNQG